MGLFPSLKMTNKNFVSRTGRLNARCSKSIIPIAALFYSNASETRVTGTGYDSRCVSR